MYHVWYWHETGNPCSEFVSNSPINFVEEDGEISLALLAHTCTRHSIKFDHKSISDLYQLIGLYRQTCFDTMSDLGLKFNKQKHVSVKATDTPVTTVVHHFRKVIRSLRNRSWTNYGVLSPDLKMILCKAAMKPVYFSQEKRFCPKSFSSVLRTIVLNLERLLFDRNDAGLDFFGCDSSSCSSEDDENTSNQSVPVTRNNNIDASNCNATVSQGAGRMNQRNPLSIPTTQLSQTRDPDSSTSDIQLDDNRRSYRRSNGRNKASKQVRKVRRRSISSETDDDSSFSEQRSNHAYHSRKFSIGFIHCIRFSPYCGTEYKVHWRNFPDCKESDTWETAEMLKEDCPDILRDFEANL